jgi:hypothetical protein
MFFISSSQPKSFRQTFPAFTGAVYHPEKLMQEHCIRLNAEKYARNIGKAQESCRGVLIPETCDQGAYSGA